LIWVKIVSTTTCIVEGIIVLRSRSFRISIYANETLQINMPYWVIEAICKHIVAQEALTGSDQCVRIDESADFRVVISGLQIIESGLCGVDLAASP
jgi:hypothetical protein